MDTEILNILAAYGVETIVIALLINLLTNIVKKPIKAYSKKSGKDINKYISCVPIVLGFGGAFMYYVLTVGWSGLVIDSVFTLGVSCSSLSLAIFAVFEKFIPKAKEQSVDVETAPSANYIVSETENKSEAPPEIEEQNKIKRSKIILHGKKQ